MNHFRVGVERWRLDTFVKSVLNASGSVDGVAFDRTKEWDVRVSLSGSREEAEEVVRRLPHTLDYEVLE